MPRSPVDLIPRETLYLDLNYSEEDLLARMKPKGRYNIRLSQKKNLLLEEGCKPNQIRDFYRVLQEASRRDDFLLEPFAFFVNLIDTLQAANSIKLFLVRHEDSLLGSLLLTTYGQRATYLYGGISNQKRNLMAGYALQWAAIKAAQNADCRTYDFYGFDRFGRPDHNYARFSRFKKQFGGSAINFIGGRDLYFNERLADAVVNVFKNANVMTSFR
jgi:lipid II:glycine glycyltransferase (peptidoglycan interpeptide bridge formation enzyme)